MFAGKTSTLVSDLHRASSIYNGISIYITHTLDQRETLTQPTENYKKGKISSHSQLTRMGHTTIDFCLQVSKLSTTLEQIRNLSLTNCIAAIGIDEAQFFDAKDLVQTVKYWCLPSPTAPCAIFVTGLDGDSNQNHFRDSGILLLLPKAEEFKKLKTAVCLPCMNNSKESTLSIAPFTIKHSHIGASSIGGAEQYAAVCRKHLHRS
jgi:thymidine kinase